MNSVNHIIKQIQAQVDGGKSVSALAREIGLPQNTLFRVVAGQNMPSYRTITAIEKYLSAKQEKPETH